MNIGPFFGVANIVVPKEGPKVGLCTADFSNAAQVEIDGQLAVDSGKISYIQGVYIDNSKNANPITLTMSTTNQIISCPAGYQGYFTILCPNDPTILAQTTQANVQIPLIFYNMPVQPAVWKAI
jgi:hypothetical protein